MIRFHFLQRGCKPCSGSVSSGGRQVVRRGITKNTCPDTLSLVTKMGRLEVTLLDAPDLQY